ncbi:GntR family transcriptional regulator [Salsuginibacillus halophilus]|uniref:GntR family transcriptional regulator n=1 Tax=Salsuginibacillus halophilus TaxID=517424 RepID=A0A2P8HL86_9BACI|nr:GntR family transcriptional regulator [Salsuginibacillus halophilus]PSL46966.1 GntR family transcriptional regulator [Salsuginibacillus halophilus]
MDASFDDQKPIFIQIKEKIEDQIVNGYLQEDEKIPSTTQMVDFYKVNHLTISKGMNLLADEGVIYKKRGVGMFVAEGAQRKVKQQRKASFADDYVRPMMQEAEKLGLSEDEVNHLIQQVRRGDRG